MSRIALVVSDVDGTLVTRDKRLTDAARAAVQRLHDAGVAFTITSSRPPFGMTMLLKPLAVALPFGAFNGSSIVGPGLEVVSRHVIPPDAARRSLDVLADCKVDAWLFTDDQWLIANPDGDYVTHEAKTIQTKPTVVTDFGPVLSAACKIVGVSADAERLKRCEATMQAALGESAHAVRSQTYYLDVTPPGQDKGVFVRAIAARLAIATEAVATIGDMQNDVPMFKASGLSVAMGNATDEVKAHAMLVTDSNEDEGFAHAVDMILARQRTDETSA
jgi:Cof subfamily protein (haloacid dehalogenase superfamily)